MDRLSSPIASSEPSHVPSDETVGTNSTNEANEVSLNASPLWSQNGWALTWPIWHLLPLQERRQLAHDHGFKTIGAFEEYMSLHQAMDDSEVSRPYANALVYPIDWTNIGAGALVQNVKPVAVGNDQEDNENDSDCEDKSSLEKQASSVSDDLSLEKLLELGGMILMLHEEILHQVFSWLPVDTYATLGLVSPHWKHLTRTEAVYKRLCERLYLNQSKRRQLHVSRFGSYRTMLEQRPRVRAAGGCYVLKYSQIKQIQRDMWTEVPHGAILESVYYRYLYFQEDGRVLYALTSAPPHEMFHRLLKVCLKKHDDSAAVWGTYLVQKNYLTITARQPWHAIRFELTIESKSRHGRFGSLTLNRHLSSPTGSFEEWSSDRVEYSVPMESFRFVKSSFL